MAEVVEVIECDVLPDSVNTVQKKSQGSSETHESSIKSWKETAGVPLTPKYRVGTKFHIKLQRKHSKSHKQLEDLPYNAAGLTLQSTTVEKKPEGKNERRHHVRIRGTRTGVFQNIRSCKTEGNG